MKNQFLFPYQLKKPALVLLLISIVMGSYLTFIDESPDFFDVKTYDIETGKTVFGAFRYWMTPESFSMSEPENLPTKDKFKNLGDTLVGSLLILSLLIFAFSKEKHEDEYLQKIRLDSLLWATYINYGLLFVAFFLLWDFDFLSVMMYNMFTHLLIFVIRFNYFKLKINQSLNNEE